MNALIIQTDFGLYDGAVNAMFGVAYSVCPDLKIYNLMHEIKPYDIWDASYRLTQVLNYWPEGTVFVSVVDPGVGTSRKSVVAKTKGGRYIVTPNNGTLTHIFEKYGIEEMREIEENVNRLKGSSESYTFHGRDVYVYTAARLAAGIISFEEVGPSLDIAETVLFPTHKPYIENNTIVGIIDVLDVRFGSPWTNIPHEMLKEIDVDYGDKLNVLITHKGDIYYDNDMVVQKSFGDAKFREELVFVNSLLNVSFALNQGSFAGRYDVGSGQDWEVRIRKAL